MRIKSNPTTTTTFIFCSYYPKTERTNVNRSWRRRRKKNAERDIIQFIDFSPLFVSCSVIFPFRLYECKCIVMYTLQALIYESVQYRLYSFYRCSGGGKLATASYLYLHTTQHTYISSFFAAFISFLCCHEHGIINAMRRVLCRRRDASRHTLVDFMREAKRCRKYIVSDHSIPFWPRFRAFHLLMGMGNMLHAYILLVYTECVY